MGFGLEKRELKRDLTHVYKINTCTYVQRGKEHRSAQ